MRIVTARPPMFPEILAAFPGAAARGVIFTFGQTVFNPSGVKIPRELMAHEEIHAERQGSSDEAIEAWWRRYILDPGFRLQEELPAHRAEYRAFCKRHGASFARVKYLNLVAQRLASRLYGGLLTLDAARDLIVRAA